MILVTVPCITPSLKTKLSDGTASARVIAIAEMSGVGGTMNCLIFL